MVALLITRLVKSSALSAEYSFRTGMPHSSFSVIAMIAAESLLCSALPVFHFGENGRP